MGEMIYRQTRLGQCLEDALEEMGGEIDADLREKVLESFDRVAASTSCTCRD
jgi:hypothetical protein